MSGSDIGSNVAPRYFIESAEPQFSIADGLGCSFVRGWSALHGSVVRAVSDVMESCSRMDVLAQVTSVLPVRHRVAKFVVANLWHGRDSQQSELAQERRIRYADQVANVVTLMTDLDC